MQNSPNGIIQNIDHVINLIKQNGQGFLDVLRHQNSNNPSFSFIYPESPYFVLFKNRLDTLLQNTTQTYPSNDTNSPLINTGNKPGSRWGPSSYSGTNENLSYNQHQYGQPSPPIQQFNNYNTTQQTSPIGYSGISPTNIGHLSNMNNLNQGNSNVYNANQGQYFNNMQQGYPNYQMGNVNQGMQQTNSMMYGNSNSSPTLPSYMHSSHQVQQYPKTNERKSSVDKRDMEIESPRGKQFH